MIKFNKIHLIYDNKIIIRNLTFNIKKGEKAIILGKSGIGKSSLLSMILGFITPSDGEIQVAGIPVEEKSVWDIRKKIAYLDQDVSLCEGKTSELLNFISKLKANSRTDFTNRQISELFNYFEISSDFINKDIGDLSGGERQRLGIIISILLKRDIFLLDEVTSALDEHLKKKVVNYFIERKDWTCLVISHDPVWYENNSVKIFDMEEGKWKQ